MILPEKGKRVIAWVEDEDYPFIGYYDEINGWCMETEYLNYDAHRNDIFGKVIAWSEIPEMPEQSLDKQTQSMLDYS